MGAMMSTYMLFCLTGAGSGFVYLRYTSVSDGGGGGASSGGIELLDTARSPASAPRSAIT